VEKWYEWPIRRHFQVFWRWSLLVALTYAVFATIIGREVLLGTIMVFLTVALCYLTARVIYKSIEHLNANQDENFGGFLSGIFLGTIAYLVIWLLGQGFLIHNHVESWAFLLILSLSIGPNFQLKVGKHGQCESPITFFFSFLFGLGLGGSLVIILGMGFQSHPIQAFLAISSVLTIIGTSYILSRIIAFCLKLIISFLNQIRFRQKAAKWLIAG